MIWIKFLDKIVSSFKKHDIKLHFLHKMQLILIYDPDLVDKLEHIVIMNKTCHETIIIEFFNFAIFYPIE